MISNERPSPYGSRPPKQFKPPVQEDTLKFGQLEIGGTSFVFMLKANPRGQFLRITESSAKGLASLIIPDSGLENFNKMLEKMFQASAASIVAEHVFKTEQVQVERKNFTFQLDQREQGRFLRIIENAGGRANEIIIPSHGLEDFKNLADEMLKAANEPHSSMSSAEEALKTEKMQLEHKSFTFLLRKNRQGRFLRITEEKYGHFNNLIIPADGLEEFKKLVMEMAEASKKLNE